MPAKRTVHHTTVEIAFEGASAPEWVQLTPTGPDLEARDGRVHRLTQPERIVAQFKSIKQDLPIDVEHASEVRAKEGLSAPACGWISEMEVRDGAIWGRVSWTGEGADWVANRAYRYLSPAYLVDANGDMIAIVSAGLTNNPAFVMPALARAGETEETTTMDKAIAEALGIDPNATAAQAVAKIKDIQSDVQTARAAVPDPAKFAPIEQLEAANAKVTKLEEAETARADAELDAVVQQGVTDGKIAPAAKDGFLAMARAQGAETFVKTLAAMPKVVGGLSSVGDETAAKFTPEQVEIARASNQTPEELFGETKKDA